MEGILQVFNLLLALVEKALSVTELRVEFLRDVMSLQLGGLFYSDDLLGILDGKD